MSCDFSGLKGLTIRRGAIATRVARLPTAERRGWLEAVLVASLDGDAEARTTLLAGAHAVAYGANTALALRSLDEGLEPGLAPVTEAFICATAAPSHARRLPARARLGGDEHPMGEIRGAFGPYDEVTWSPDEEEIRRSDGSAAGAYGKR